MPAPAFFAYLGVDSIATSAEETRDPSRDMPIGIIGSLVLRKTNLTPSALFAAPGCIL